MNQSCTPAYLPTVALNSLVQDVVNAINTNQIVPYGDYGSQTVYYFQPMNNGLGYIVYTTFDKETSIGLSSFMVFYGAATTIHQVLFGQLIRTQIDLQWLVLPQLPIQPSLSGSVSP